MNAKTYFPVGLAALILLSSLWSCSGNDVSGSYAKDFPEYQKKEIEFSIEGLSAPIFSPFEHETVYPMGKIMLENGRVLALVVVRDEEEPIGKVWAELIEKGKRLDKLTVAEADLGYFSTCKLDIPLIHILDESRERTYKIAETGFEKVD